MKNLLCHSLAVAVIAAGVSLNVLAEPPSGQVDFGKLAMPGNGGEFVEIQVNSNLLSLAAKLVEKQQPDAAKLLRGVQLVRVNVIGLTDENRDEMTNHVRQIRHDLAPKVGNAMSTCSRRMAKTLAFTPRPAAERHWRGWSSQ